MQPRQQNRQGGPVNLIIGIIFLFIVLAGIYYAFTFAKWLLGFLALPLLIATFIIDRQVIFNYGKMIGNWFKTNPIMGILAILFTVVLSPFVIAFLFGKAMLKRKVGKLTNDYTGRSNDEYVKYEDLTEEEFEMELNQDVLKEDMELTDLHNDPNPNPLDKSKKKDTYDELFDDIDFEEDSSTN